jgi:hypothetical protein
MTKYDHLEIRCPRLGGEVRFAYCRREASELPCQRIILCWATALPVETYLKEYLGEKGWELFCLQTPGNKINTIIDLAETAKKYKQ